jgi:hypothetical protein
MLGFRKYWNRDVPVSKMSFYPVEHPEQQSDKNVPLDGVTILAKRSSRFGEQVMNCWDLIHHNKFVGSSPTDPALADIACSTDNDDFYAHFSGWRGDAPTFYETLQRITFVSKKQAFAYFPPPTPDCRNRTSGNEPFYTWAHLYLRAIRGSRKGTQT